MEEIRVELAQSPIGNGATLTVTIGDRDVSEGVGAARIATLRGYLPPAHRAFMRVSRQRYLSIRDYLRRDYINGEHRLPPEVLCDAIRAYVSEIAPELLGEGSVVSTLESDSDVIERLTAAEPGYLTIGGRTFQLQSTGKVSPAGGKLLVQIRQRAAEAIRRERDALMAAARSEAAIIRRQVTAERDQFRAEQQAEAQRRTQANRMVVPDWLAGQTVRWSPRGDIEVLQAIAYQPVRWSFPGWEVWVGDDDPEEDEESLRGDRRRDRTCEIEWRVDRPAAAQNIYTWIVFHPTTGAFELDRAKIAEWSPQLPHASHSSMCCQPQGLPTAIRDMRSLQQVIAAINRTFKEVNLSSLLVTLNSLTGEVKASVPSRVMDWYEQWQDEGTQSTDAFAFGAAEVGREVATTIWGRG